MLSTETTPQAPLSTLNGSLGLPVEVLQAIFLKKLSNRRARIKLSQVCRLWRKIIHDTVEFWVTIYPFSPHSVDTQDALRRVEWLAQRSSDSRALKIIWTPVSVISDVDITYISTYFLQLVPTTRWNSLYISVWQYDAARILRKREFFGLESLNIGESWCLTAAMARPASSPLTHLTLRKCDDLTPVEELNLIGPTTKLHFTRNLPWKATEQLSFSKIRHLHIPILFYWPNNDLFQYITNLKVDSLNPYQVHVFRMPCLKHLYIGKLFLYIGLPGFTVTLSSVEELEIANLGGGDGLVCRFDVPVLQKLRLGRPERRLLAAFQGSPYTHLTLESHIYMEMIPRVIKPHLTHILILHIICGPLSIPCPVFPLFDEEENILAVGLLSELHISMLRRRLISDELELEQPARHFLSKHSLKLVIIDWTDGSELRIMQAPTVE